MTYERSTQTYGRTVAIDRSIHFKMYGDLYADRKNTRKYGEEGYVESGGNLIRQEYNWDNSYML